VADNVTVARTTSAGFVTAFSDDLCEVPFASNLNFGPGATTANAAVIGVSQGSSCSGGPSRVAFYNPFGELHLVVDISGYFTGIALLEQLTIEPVISAHGSFTSGAVDREHDGPQTGPFTIRP